MEKTIWDTRSDVVNHWLDDHECGVCGGSVNEEGYGECEECHSFFCVEHNHLVNGICQDCIEKSLKKIA